MAFRDWDKLLYGLDRGECILFLGPELPSVSAGGERSIPIEELARRLCADLSDPGPGPDPGHLPYIAQRYLAQEGDVALEMEISHWHDGLGEAQSALHDDLAVLPWRWIVTSGHDPLMAEALRRAGKTPAVERYHYRGPSKELLPEPSVEAPVLYHLYGHVAEPPSLVVTETQLLDFLANLIARDPPLPNDLNEALANGRLFLFLGFGLRQWYLRILLRVLKVLRHGNRAFALETLNEDGGSEDAILFYRENFRMDLFHEDVVEFVRELRERYEALPGGRSFLPSRAPAAASAALAGAASPAASAGLPTVFLCHASEDADRAREVHEALVSAGLQPWLDKEALRGGDRWDERIEATIEQVDYFVVLNSRSLVAKSRDRSYVNKEIKRALKADELRLIGSFIIPVALDDAPLLEPLARFQAVDLRSSDGLRDLVRAIKRQVGAA